MLDEHELELTHDSSERRTDAATPHPVAPDGPSGRSAPPLDRAWLAITWFVVAVCNWAFSGDRVIFHLLADEPGSLAMARWLGGRNRWNMFDHSTWQPALSVLITPAYWFTLDPEVLVRWALAVNAAIAGAAAVVTVLLARRLGGLSTKAAALLAIVVATTPSALSGAAFVWAEPMIALTSVTVTLCAIRLLDGDGDRWAYAAVLTAAGGYFAHARLLPYLALAIILIATIALWHRRPSLAGGAVLAGAAGFGLVRLITTTIHIRVWDDPGRVNTSGSVLRRLDQPFDVLDHLVGQLWYQLTVTLGVGALGVVVVLRTLFTGDRPGVVSRHAAIVVFVLTAPMLAVSATFLTNRGRADQLVYGRYNDAVMWPVVLIGLCWLVSLAREGWSRRRGVDTILALVAVVTTATVTEIRHGDVLDADIGLRAMVPGVLAFVGRLDAVPIERITVISLGAATAALVAVTVLRRRPTTLAAAAAVAAVVALTVGAVRTHDGEARLLNGWTRVAPVREVDALVPPDAALGVKMVPDSRDPSLSWQRQRHRFQVYQLYLPERSFHRDRGLDDDVGPYVFAPTDDPELEAAGARIVWDDPGANMSLYLEPQP